MKNITLKSLVALVALGTTASVHASTESAADKLRKKAATATAVPSLTDVKDETKSSPSTFDINAYLSAPAPAPKPAPKKVSAPAAFDLDALLGVTPAPKKAPALTAFDPNLHYEKSAVKLFNSTDHVERSAITEFDPNLHYEKSAVKLFDSALHVDITKAKEDVVEAQKVLGEKFKGVLDTVRADLNQAQSDLQTLNDQFDALKTGSVNVAAIALTSSLADIATIAGDDGKSTLLSVLDALKANDIRTVLVTLQGLAKDDADSVADTEKKEAFARIAPVVAKINGFINPTT